MVQFNLLPDVKLDYIKAKRSQQLITTIAGLVTIISLTVLVLLFLIVNVLQKQHLKSVGNDIKTKSSTLESTPDLNKVLTVQNQLNSLPNIHAGKPVVSRLFSYLGQIVPANVKISDIKLDYTAYTISISGNADSIKTINQFVDTLKFTTYSVSGVSGQNNNAFTSVVLGSFSSDTSSATSGGSSAQPSYSITATFNKDIFDGTKSISLTVPNKITTRSNIDTPTDLFTNTKQNNTQQSP